MKSIFVDSSKNQKKINTKNWNHEQKFYRTRPGTGRKYKAVLKPDPEPPDILCQF